MQSNLCNFYKIRLSKSQTIILIISIIVMTLIVWLLQKLIVVFYIWFTLSNILVFEITTNPWEMFFFISSRFNSTNSSIFISLFPIACHNVETCIFLRTVSNFWFSYYSYQFFFFSRWNNGWVIIPTYLQTELSRKR